nr:hypothetical protein [Mucilaginibacter sp. SP1R1]MBB6148350.1 hypothetical protein [Mucilaginibacter sp. SP1R1]
MPPAAAWASAARAAGKVKEYIKCSANLGRGAFVNVVGGDDTPGTAAWDAAFQGEYIDNIFDAARIEPRIVDNIPVNFVRGATEQDVNVGTPPRFNYTHRVSYKNCTRLRVVIDDAGRGVIDAVPLPELTRADLDERFNEKLRIQSEQLFWGVRNAKLS